MFGRRNKLLEVTNGIIDDAEARLSDAYEYNRAANAEVKRLEGLLKAEQEISARHKRNLEEEQARHAQTKSERDQAREDLEWRKEMLSDLKLELAEEQAESKALRKDLSRSEAAREELVAKCDRLERQVDEAQDWASEKESEADYLRHQLSHAFGVIQGIVDTVGGSDRTSDDEATTKKVMVKQACRARLSKTNLSPEGQRRILEQAKELGIVPQDALGVGEPKMLAMPSGSSKKPKKKTKKKAKDKPMSLKDKLRNRR